MPSISKSAVPYTAFLVVEAGPLSWALSVPCQTGTQVEEAADCTAEQGACRGDGALLHDLLVAALDRAVPRVQGAHIAVPIGQQLDLQESCRTSDPPAQMCLGADLVSQWAGRSRYAVATGLTGTAM